MLHSGRVMDALEVLERKLGSAITITRKVAIGKILVQGQRVHGQELQNHLPDDS
jgi:hypothetical protein